MLKRIGAESTGGLKALASGTLPCGRPAIVNADGTVSVVSETVNIESVGSAVVYESSGTGSKAIGYDTSNDKIVVAYQDQGNSNYGTAIVGTVSGTSISFGTAVVYESANIHSQHIVFDSSNNKVVIIYADAGNSDHGTAVVGTVSGTSISFGTPVVFNAGAVAQLSADFDTSANKVVIAYSDAGGKAIVGTVSGTSISFGSEAEFEGGGTYNTAVAYDANANKTVIAYRDNGNSDYGKAIVGTVSGTSISFGSIVNFDTQNSRDIMASYDPVNQKVLIVYKVLGGGNPGYGIVGTVSGTSISFGTRVAFHTGSTDVNRVVYDSAAQKHVIVYRDHDPSPNHGRIRVATISGTSVSYSDEFTWSTTNFSEPAIAYDPDQGKVVIAYVDPNNSSYGTAKVYQQYSIEQNLTSENYIGMSRGVAKQTGDAAVTGAETVFEAGGASPYINSVYDANAQKVVIVYNDSADSTKGKGIVGTVSGTAISFGSPTSFHTGADDMKIAYDSVSQKVVIAFRDSNQPIPCRAVVGTVSGTSISFGSTVIFDSNYSLITGIAYDANAERIVIGYRRQSGTNSTYGHTIVGTVSGTSISFGTPVVVNSASTSDISPVYDSNAQKVVVTYSDVGDSEKGKAKVGTVSGTSISYGSAVVWNNASTEKGAPLYYAPSQKIIIAFKDAGNSGYGTAIIGTVSGDSISFGSESVFESAAAEYFGIAYDSNAGKVIIAYRDQGNSNYGNLVVGTVSGTNITFDTPTVFNAANSSYMQATYDTNAQKTVISFYDGGNSNYGTSFTFSPSTIATTRAEVASGQLVRLDIIGSVSDNQIGLTAGQQYFVQNDGTISTTAASPSVLAGTAISATELVVKT